MPHYCPLCGALGATCGTPTRVVPVDQRITGYRVAGDQLVPNVPTPSDMTAEEKEEWQTMVVAMGKRSLRQQLKERTAQAMAEGKAPHTSLSYVDRGDGILVKMAPDDAKAYVEQNEGASIVREGALPQPVEGEVVGATKATVGAVYDDSGVQKDDSTLLTSRSFSASSGQPVPPASEAKEPPPPATEATATAPSISKPAPRTGTSGSGSGSGKS